MGFVKGFSDHIQTTDILILYKFTDWITFFGYFVYTLEIRVDISDGSFGNLALKHRIGKKGVVVISVQDEIRRLRFAEPLELCQVLLCKL